MKAKWWVCGVIGVLLLGVAIIFIIHHRGLQKTKNINATVVVDGNIIVNQYAKILSDHIELPLVDILLSVGYSVDWLDTTTAVLSDGERNLKLDIAAHELVNLDDNENILRFPNGGKMYLCCTFVNKNLILDEVTLRALMYTIGIKMDISIDTECAKIVINTSRV